MEIDIIEHKLDGQITHKALSDDDLSGYENKVLIPGRIFLDDLFRYYTNNVKGSILYSYRGLISSKTIGYILNVLETQFSNIPEIVIRKRMLYFSIELLQNIQNYKDVLIIEGTENTFYDPFSFYLIKEDSTQYHFITGNYVVNSKIFPITKNLKLLNSLSIDQLKMKLRYIKMNGKFNERGGAGLGFMDMIKKTGNPVSFESIRLNSQFSLIGFQISLNKVI